MTIGGNDPAAGGRRAGEVTAEIKLSLPLDADWLALARTTGAAVASRADFSYEEIADLRLAIDEMCLSLLERTGSNGRVELVFTLNDAVLRVDAEVGRRLGAHVEEVDPTVHEFSERILDALVDHHGAAVESQIERAWLEKRREAVSP